MKAICLLLFLMVSCAALMEAIGYAVPSNPGPQQTSPEGAAKTVSGDSRDAAHGAPANEGNQRKNGKPSDEQRERRNVSDTKIARSRASLSKANRPKPLPNAQVRFSPGDAMNLQQPGSNKSVGAARGGLIQQGTVNTALRVRPTNVLRPTVPLTNNVRHHGANPAVVRGSVNSNSRNTAAINETRMIRRP
jgi:hypothetical protein